MGEEFASTRKNHARAMDSLGASLEAEQRAKADALRIKKKLEGEINELEIGLDHANKANNEGLKAIKRYQGQLKETIQAYEDQARLKQQITEPVRCRRATRGLRGRSRSCSSPKTRTRRTRIGCPSLRTSCRPRSRRTSSRSRRRRRSPPSTLPSSARPSRSWRKPLSELPLQRCPLVCKHLPQERVPTNCLRC